MDNICDFRGHISESTRNLRSTNGFKMEYSKGLYPPILPFLCFFICLWFYEPIKSILPFNIFSVGLMLSIIGCAFSSSFCLFFISNSLLNCSFCTVPQDYLSVQAVLQLIEAIQRMAKASSPPKETTLEKAVSYTHLTLPTKRIV